MQPPKVLVANIGFDRHARGSRAVVLFLRDAGMGVVCALQDWQRDYAAGLGYAGRPPYTRGENCATLWRELGFGQPLAMV